MSLLRFDKFMEHALHHPTQGYYAKKINTVGRTGDFSTSATLSSSLAHSIAQWLLAEAQHHNLKKVHVLEVGAGSGQLMLDVRKALPWHVRRCYQFHIVETSEPLKLQQQKLLGKKVSWHGSPAEAMAATHGHVLVYSNELVDAFPVRVFKSVHNKIEELFIDTKTRQEVFEEATDIASSYYFENCKSDKSIRFEVHQSYQQWLTEWASKLIKGSILTIDYGSNTQEILREKPTGTLRAYLHHTLVQGNGIYQNVGHQDITCDVNFSDLIKWGEELGLEHSQFWQQSEFLEHRESTVDQFLSDEHGAGSAFKVLSQRKSG